jgi:hypothetical protein
MDKPTSAKARTVYHSADLVEARKAEPLTEPAAARFILRQLAMIRPADEKDESMLSLIHNLTILGSGE